ncbi:J domain-containing protein [Sphingomonas jatrophae]|uniref:DnaJ domain-containing protein n=1 Tax=Sphingomonas jatrophae TaxID=1166337 RepID=A0A1I6LI24_9SPHN|nr:J domain-containing protein [Sphingomonas jatrophae]SFS03109.1 DnaJ domain-containing protein [Sphingomonas jatrophae]
MAEQGKRRETRFHGRIEREETCAHPGCTEPGEFRAPGERRGGFDGPGEWRWLCLDHVRAFNGGYNFFSGMSTEEIEAAQRPYAGWERETRAFAAGAGSTPRWADFTDPLDAIQASLRGRMADAAPRADGRPLSDADRRSLKVLKLGPDADRRELRERYAELVRRYHPDRNGGDRSHEKALGEVIAAYQHLRKAAAFA